MAELGTYYITIMPSMNKFTGAVNSAMSGMGEDAGNRFNTSFMDVLRGSALGTLVGNLATQLGGALMDGINTGVTRIDTIQNFPRVMQALGYSTSEADSSIQLIMKHLDGLPTTTQDMVTLTQAIADSTGDLDLATRASLGFNDMMLANGASAGEMTQAMGVFNRVLGKGNATAAQWMSLQSVMPAQLNMVAREMLGEGASAETLRDALNDGTVSWNDFLSAIVRLDEEGNGTVASFADQARANIDGIGTALTNLPNRIGQGWAEIFDAIGRSNVSGLINDISYGIRDAMKWVADGIRYFVDAIGQTDIAQHFADVMGRVGKAIGDMAGDTGLLRSLADALVFLIDGAFDWMAEHGAAVETAVWGIAGALAALVGWNFGTWAFNAASGLGAIVSAAAGNPFLLIAGGIAAVATALWGFFTQTETGQQLWQNFCTLMSELWAGLQEDFAFLMQRLGEEWESFNAWLQGVPAFWQGVWDALVLGVQGLVTQIVDYWNQSVEQTQQAWTNLQNAVRNALTNVGNAIRDNFTQFVNNIRNWWNGVRDATQQTWNNIVNAIRNALTGAWNAITQTFTNIVNGIRNWWANTVNNTRDAWNNLTGAVRNAATNVHNAIRDAFTNIVNGIRNWWNSVVQSTNDAWNRVRNATSNAWSNVRTVVGDAVSNVRNAISSGFNAARDTVTSVFNGIRDGIRDRLQSAYNTVSSIISNIRGLFNFSWSLPRPSLPHINWHWSSIGGLLRIPVFDGISWYAKGGLFTSASVIGIGEHGDEAALPLNDAVYSRIAKGIDANMQKASGVVVTGNTFVVRKESDIDAIAESLYLKITREQAGAL